MDAETFNLVDGTLADQGYHDDRTAAEDILELAVKEGTLHDAARVVGDRYALRPSVVIEWYTEVLNRRVQKTTELLQKITELRADNVGSQ